MKCTNDLMIYLKTTETCQLDCSHCFTSGSRGAKGWFDPDKTISFLQKLHEYNPNYLAGNIAFHGGEPLLAPLESLYKVWDECKDLWPNFVWSIQTNLTYPLTEDKRHFLNNVCSGVGTSWDKNIRWPDYEKELQWEQNVIQLTRDGVDITCMVCLTTEVLQMEPIDVISKLAMLGISNINFERVTSTGSLIQNSHLLPDNKELDAWILKMWHQSVEHDTYEYVNNLFFDSILTSLVYNTHAGCRCRQCEQKIFTINANGTIGGCPNSAVIRDFGTIEDTIEELMTSTGRLENITIESIRNPACYRCEVFDVCNGDCHQLAWQDGVCAAPISLMRHLKTDGYDVELFKKFLNDFMGQE